MKPPSPIILAFTALMLASLACQLTTSTDKPPDTDLLFEDDFSNTSGNWYTYVDANGITDYHQEGFRIYINETNAYHWTNPDLSYTDVRIEVEATKLGGPDENDFGVICRYQDENNFYFSTISSDGYFGISKIVDGAEYFIGMEELGFDDAAIKTDGARNLIRVDCIGNMITLYANGIKLVEANDADFSSGDIGLIAGTYDEPGTDILFDNLIVHKP